MKPLDRRGFFYDYYDYVVLNLVTTFLYSLN
ncbi:MAG: hypothetical protein RL699_34 [Bacteroidota bacterium]|jgi:hypothetical protein